MRFIKRGTDLAHLKHIWVAGNLNYCFTEICCIFLHTIIQISRNSNMLQICQVCAALYYGLFKWPLIPKNLAQKIRFDWFKLIDFSLLTGGCFTRTISKRKTHTRAIIFPPPCSRLLHPRPPGLKPRSDLQLELLRDTPLAHPFFTSSAPLRDRRRKTTIVNSPNQLTVAWSEGVKNTPFHGNNHFCITYNKPSVCRRFTWISFDEFWTNGPKTY